MCIGVCIDLFFDLIFRNKIILLLRFIGSYYRTISDSSQVYRNQLKARILRFLARILSPVINWTQPESSHSWGHKWGHSVFGPGICPQ